MMVYKVWTDAEIEKLKTLWAAGVSARVIAAQIGDISRNGVIGKAHRMGLSTPKTNGHGGKRVPKATWSGPMVEVEASPSSMPEPESLRVSLADIGSDSCRWIAGDPLIDPSMCGHPAKGNLCPHHRSRAYQPLQPRKDAA